MLQFILPEHVIVSEKSFARFTPRNETISALKLRARFVNEQFTRGSCRWTVNRTGLRALLADVMALLLLDFLFSGPDGDQRLATWFEQTNEFSQGQQSSVLLVETCRRRARRFTHFSADVMKNSDGNRAVEHIRRHGNVQTVGEKHLKASFTTDLQQTFTPITADLLRSENSQSFLSSFSLSLCTISRSVLVFRYFPFPHPTSSNTEPEGN